MPCKKCSNGKYRIGSGQCKYTTLEKCKKALAAYYRKKRKDNMADKIYLRGIIGLSVTANEFVDQLNRSLDKDNPVDVVINSPGGSVYQGLEIYNSIVDANKEGADINLY